jgi:hypothetical protein
MKNLGFCMEIKCAGGNRINEITTDFSDRLKIIC